MKLKRLDVDLQPSYADNAGKYVATVEYEDAHSTVKLVLTPEVSEALLTFIAPALAKCANRAALEVEQNILASVEESKRLLELNAPSGPEVPL